MTLRKVLWLFGLPSAGKTTLACLLRDRVKAINIPVIVLDGDEFRSGVSKDLGFDVADRAENIRRAAEVAKILHNQGSAVICAFVTPQEQHRAIVKTILGDCVSFIFIHCPLAVCEIRDVKGLYRKALSQHLNMTGSQAGFDVPAVCDLIVDTQLQNISQCCDTLVRFCLSDPS